MILKLIKNRKFIFLLILLILTASFCVGIVWYKNKINLINKGLAKSSFPYHEYSMEELWEQGKWPEEDKIKDIPTKRTSEQTYSEFRNALENNDIEKASKYFLPWEQNEMEKRLKQIKEQELLEQMLSDLPKKINNLETNRISAWYEYTISRNGKKYIEIISFVKDLNGDWRIKSL